MTANATPVDVLHRDVEDAPGLEFHYMRYCRALLARRHLTLRSAPELVFKAGYDAGRREAIPALCEHEDQPVGGAPGMVACVHCGRIAVEGGP